MPRPSRAAALTESQVAAQVVAAAAAWGLRLERRNVGGVTDARGRYVAFGTPGDADWTGTVPVGPNRGRRIEVEVKRGDFDPGRLRGGRAAREHFDRQLARHRLVNADGGLALWVRDLDGWLRALARIMTQPGLEIIYEGDYPVMEWDRDPPGNPGNPEIRKS
jgi:hypothetical protein